MSLPTHAPVGRRDFLTAAAAAAVAVGVPRIAPAKTAAAPAAEWRGWRGPGGDNHAAAGAGAPASMTADRVAWSVPVPGRGHSSPVVAGDSVYLTTADERAGTQSVLAFDTDGTPRWARVVHDRGLPEENHPKNTEASPTVAFDGTGLLAAFYNGGAIRLTRLNAAGEIEWQRVAGAYAPQKYKYGYAASPHLHGGGAIVGGDFDGNAFLACLDAATGEERWKVRRPSATSFSSPVVARVAGRDQLLLSGGRMVAGYDPADGSTLWTAPGATTMATCGTCVWDESRVFASGGYPEAETVAIDAADGRVVWSNRVKCYEQSMLVVDEHLYGVSDGGVVYCWRCEDGTIAWRERIGGAYSSSPLLVGDTIHVFDETARGTAFAANPDGYERRGETKLGDAMFASPVTVRDTTYLRVAKLDGGLRRESLLAVR